MSGCAGDRLPAIAAAAFAMLVSSSAWASEPPCLTCHPFEKEQIDFTAHAKLFLGTSAIGCEGCHRDGAEHARTGGKAPIFEFKDITPRQIAGRCLACHQEKQAVPGYLRSEHALAGLSCLDCHHPHLYKSKKYVLNEPSIVGLCQSCHKEVQAQFLQLVHHRVPEGAVSCVDCHEPHGSGNRHMVKGNDDSACFLCHADKRGPFLYEHATVRTEGCMSCHVPHGSANRHLLKQQELRLLCLSCHPVHPPFVNQATLRFQDCTRCHVKIHGSNSSRRFFE